MSAKTHWQSQRSFEVKATKTRKVEGFIFGRGAKHGFSAKFAETGGSRASRRRQERSGPGS
jgi:hypothetical protein